VQMVSAHVADCVTYYTRCDPSKMSITPTVEELEAKKLMLKKCRMYRNTRSISLR